jgi:hypothetical protein
MKHLPLTHARIWTVAYMLYTSMCIINADYPTLVNALTEDEADSAFIIAPYALEHTESTLLHDTIAEPTTLMPDTSQDLTLASLSPLDNPKLPVDYPYFQDPYAVANYEHIPIKAKFSGYIQYSSWWDSRQIAQLGDDYVLAYPKRALYDADCKDINAHGDFNMTMLETRLRAEMYGPIILGAKTLGYIECDFFGDLIIINRYRLRNAFIRMKWPHVTGIFGLFWHPMFVLKTFPLTVSFDGGLPMEPISRAPQISLTIHNKQTSLVLCAMAQLIFNSNGPLGYSSIYIRNARVPSLCARISHNMDHLYCGAGIDYLRLVPRLESNTGYKVHEFINSVSAFAFATVKFEPLEIRTQLTYAQNAADRLMISGYAVSAVNPTTDERTYTNIAALGYWIDINITRKIEPGLFIGITKNLGAQQPIIPCIFDPITGVEESTVYAFLDNSENISTVFRIAPRVRVHVLPADFAFELEYTRASWGCMGSSGKVHNANPVGNLRAIFTTYYYF